MLNNLVESGSHAAAIKRRGSFFIITLGCYGVLMLLVGAASIYAYDARLTAAEEAEMVEFFFPPALAPEPRAAASRAPRSAPDTPPVLSPRPTIAPNAVASIEDTRRVPTSLSTEPINAPSLPPGLEVGSNVSNASGALIPSGIVGLPEGASRSGGGHSGTESARREPPLPPVIARPTPTPAPGARRPLRISTVLNGKALTLPMPAYPARARMAGVTGIVGVQVVIDGTGKVISAQAVSGSPLLRPSAVRAALNARFAPTMLNNQPVQVQGIINYNFKLDGT